MIKPKILVTGATGRTGGAVVTQLLAKGYPVRATVRVQDARSDLLQRRGAEVVLADIFDPGQLMSFCVSYARQAEIRPRSFHWKGEVSTDRGASWRLIVAVFARRA